MPNGDIVGREGELVELDAFLDHADEGPRALLLEGEAGVGKSTLWGAGIVGARRRGLRVLSSRPAEIERGLAHVVLADLLDGVVDEVLPALSAPRRGALEGALLVRGMPEDPLDPRALGVAVRTCFQLLAEERPLVLAIDDTQWVDASSAMALAFALRRLQAERILLLLARRLDGRTEDAGFEVAPGSHPVDRLRVGPLSSGALRLLLQRRLGRSFTRPTLLRLQEISGGNPFYALELARSVPASGASTDPLEPLLVPESLERLVSARLAELGGPTRDGLLLAAAHGRPAPALVEAAGISAEVLEPAFAAHVVELSDEVVRFTHPLLASVLYQGASEDERRGAHGRLAMLVDDPIERARHLALATVAPSEDIAATLEEAAIHARARGTVIAAAGLAERALRLTPSDLVDERQRRVIAAARAHLESGDARRALALALELLGEAQAGRRAEALVLLGEIEFAAGRVERSIDYRRQALEAAIGLPALQAEIHASLSLSLHDSEGAAAADEHAVTALELAEALGDDALRARGLSALAHSRFRAGHPDGLRLVEQVQSDAAAKGDPRQWREASFGLVHAAIWSYQLDRARGLLERIEREWSERDERTRARVFWWLALAELRAGRFPLAARHEERAMEILRQYAVGEDERPMGHWLAPLIAAHRGELEYARALAESDRRPTESPMERLATNAVLGIVELWSGDPGAAAERFVAAESVRSRLGVKEPAMPFWRADYVEALLALGRLDDAAALVTTWEADATRLGREAVLAQATRCRGLLAAARADLHAALAELERAVAQHEAAGDPFGRARALLALGTVRRRARRVRAAREAMTAALEGFEECGAASWVEEARAELGRLGGRTPSEGLTPAEHRVAALAAAGRSNREVAAALFLTEHTVETVLSRTYRKLGIRSRGQLASRLATETEEQAQANS